MESAIKACPAFGGRYPDLVSRTMVPIPVVDDGVVIPGCLKKQANQPFPSTRQYMGGGLKVEVAMEKTITLAEYVRKRNGVPLGAAHSMRNMLWRSLGADSFHRFWRYWNPIWGYYLARNVMKPLASVTPLWLAVIVTFAVSGALHDLAVTLVKWKFTFFFTPWFVCMSLFVLVSKHFDIAFRGYPWLVRACINIAIVIGCMLLTNALESVYAQ